MSMTDILSEIRNLVSTETVARYARDSEMVKRELLILRPSARIDLLVKEPQAALPTALPTALPAPANPAKGTDLHSQVTEFLIAEFRDPHSALRAALRDAINAELGGG